jgi:polysaccharide biosynthesis PFTS motif protein
MRLLLSSMRGYRKLRSSGNLQFIHGLRLQLENVKLKSFKSGYKGDTLVGQHSNAELIVKQFLLSRFVANLNLNIKILASVHNGNLARIFALPDEWRRILSSHGLSVNAPLSWIMWRVKVFWHWIIGNVRLIQYILRSLREVIRGGEGVRVSYVYFEGLSKNCLPRLAEDGKSYDVLTWYQGWRDRCTDIEVICHNVPGVGEFETHGIRVVSLPTDIPLINGLIPLFTLILWSVKANAECLVAFVKGQWGLPLLFADLFKAKVVKLLPQEALAKDYLFQSDWIFRPLWTYVAEDRGSRILFYFYSTNSEGMKTPAGYKPIDFDWRCISWPKYLVWDNYQAAFLRLACSNEIKVETVGPIWFQNSAKELPLIAEKSVAIFDVQPHRFSAYHALGAPLEYYVPDICIRFVKDVCEVANELGFQVVWKRKRSIGKLAHPKFRNFLRLTTEINGVAIVDPEVAAVRVIQATMLSVSMPFTSTALIAKHMNKGGCYYDPSMSILKDDRGAHGVEIVLGKAQLREWMSGFPPN